MSALLDTPDAVTPTPADAGLAGESEAKLARHVSPDRDTVRVSIADDADSVVVPMAAFRLFAQVLGRMARGEAVAVVPARADLTVEEAADLLNVSQPFVVKLLDDGRIPHHAVGGTRHIRFDDLTAYKRVVTAAQRRALAELAALDQELGLA
jgi:excisionase family DNA binding protein